MTSAKNGDMHNVNVALTSGANVNAHHLLQVSILIIVLIVLVVESTTLNVGSQNYSCDKGSNILMLCS